jgi:hypothetical protein
MENIPLLQGILGRKISKNRRYYYPASTNEIEPPCSIGGNPTFVLEQCRAALGSCKSGAGEAV